MQTTQLNLPVSCVLYFTCKGVGCQVVSPNRLREQHARVVCRQLQSTKASREIAFVVQSRTTSKSAFHIDSIRTPEAQKSLAGFSYRSRVRDL